MPKKKAAPQVKPKVEFINVRIPLTGKPFESFKDVIHAYHSLGEGNGASFLEGDCKVADLEINDLLELLVFVHRLMAWDATAELQRLDKIVLARLAKH